MTLAYWCIPIAMLLPLVWVGIAKASASGYDNSQPRVWLSRLDGLGQRANWAQQNSFEAFPPFVAGVIVAHLTGASQPVIDILACLFIVARIVHGVCYLLDKAMLRSLVWLVGFGISFALFLI